MKRFLKNLMIFAVCFFIFDKLFIPVWFINSTNQVDNRIKYVLEGNMNKELLVFGSSRGARDIIASRLEKQTGLTSYNISFPGADIEFQEFLLRNLLKFNKRPDIIILALDDPEEFYNTERIKFRYEFLYPYMNYQPVKEEMIERNEKNRLLSELLVLYRMNKANFDFRKKQFTKFDTLTTCGSMPVSFYDESDFKYGRNVESYNRELEIPNKILAFRKFNELCSANNIRLVLVIPPNYKNHNVQFEKRIRELKKPGSYLYVYDQFNPEYHKKQNFHDANHLVIRGSEIFSDELAAYVKELIDE